MLDPQTRAVLTEQLRPPAGYSLSHAVGTTFTLDLESALSIPLSFAGHRIAESDGALGVFDALRRTETSIDIFSQAGQMSMGTPSDLVAFLEPVIHPVVHPKGLFHPKVWFLEYASGDELAYRFVCSSRNLTADRSWDVVVRLDGAAARTAAETRLAAHTNKPLVQLLRTLPAMTVQPLSTDRLERLDALATRWSNIEWEIPPTTRDLAFHVFGVRGHKPLNLQGKRALILSPFLSDDGVQALRKDVRTTTHLVSRAESIDRLDAKSLDKNLLTYVVDSAANFDENEIGEDESTTATSAREVLVGLHAKTIVVDRLDGAHIFLGSANATTAALQRNLEVMVELAGPIPKFGVEATLNIMGNLVVPYASAGNALEDENEKALHRLEAYLRGLASIKLFARVDTEELYGLDVWTEHTLATENGITLRWELLTRPDIGGSVLPVGESDAVRLSGLALTDISPYFVLIARDSKDRERRTIVLAELLNDVESRRDAIIARQLTDTSAFIRLLSLILELAGIGVLGGAGGHGFFGANGQSASSAGLFESIVRAVGAGASGLDDAKRIIDFLSANADTTDVLPDGFAELWNAAWASHVGSLASEGGA